MQDTQNYYFKFDENFNENEVPNKSILFDLLTIFV